EDSVGAEEAFAVLKRPVVERLRAAGARKRCRKRNRIVSKARKPRWFALVEGLVALLEIRACAEIGGDVPTAGKRRLALRVAAGPCARSKQMHVLRVDMRACERRADGAQRRAVVGDQNGLRAGQGGCDLSSCSACVGVGA